MKFTLLCIVMFCTSFLFSQPVKNFQPDRISLKDLNLKGKISRIESVVTYDNIESKTYYKKVFNEDGYLIYDIMDADTVNANYFDDKNNLMRKTLNMGGGKNYLTYEIDNNGNMIKRCFDDFCYNYVWEGNILRDKYEAWEFSKDGNVLAEKNSMGVTEYNYNNKGLVIEENMFDDYGEWSITNKKEYNKNNDIIKNVNSSADENYEWVTTYTYDYDKKGNWIKKIENSGGTKTTETRTITYANDLPAAKSKSKKK